MREHNTPAVAPVASLTAFDGKGHAGDPKVHIKPPAPRHNGIGDLLRAIQYRSFDGTTDGVNNIAIDTPPVKADMYWVLLGASATSAAVIPGYALFLMPPQFVGSSAPTVNDKFAHPGVRIDSGLNIVAIDRRIIVPPGWFLRLASFGGNVAPVAALHIGLLLAFVESDQLTAEAASLLTT
jgi:hypothetical protein